jgi:hypothetical protein
MAGCIVALLAVCLLACPPAKKKGTTAFTAACATDAECVSGRCLPGVDGNGYCTQECALDLDCANDKTLYCCERLGEKAYCTQPTSGACRQAALGAGCQGPDDPFCARSQLFCADVGGARQVCTFECTTTSDCSESRGSVCGQIGSGQNVCIPPDLNNIVRLTPNCAGDRDCTGEGEICQMVLDAEADPRAYILRCTSSQKYGPTAAYQSCTADKQCDRFFCMSGTCPATCSNDSHCRPGFRCDPVGLPVPTAQGTAGTDTSIIGLCAPQQGSYRPCDSASSSCPTGESCQVVSRFDGGGAPVCHALPTVTSTAPPVSMTYAKTDEACSRLVDADNNPQTPDTWTLINSAIQLCESGACLPPGYCSAACKNDADCTPGPAAPMPPSDLVCVYEPFFAHCERTVADGSAIGAPCSAASVAQADTQCATSLCDAGACAARKGEGSACMRANECRSFVCLTGKCAKPCRADADCSGAATARVCDTLVQPFDVFNTPTNPLDDAVDLPSFCSDLPGFAAGPSCPGTACGAGLVCMPVGAVDGSLRGVCATPNSGAAVGEACMTDGDCQTKLCLGFGGAQGGRCASVCIDGADCPASTRCMPTTVSGTAISTLCLVPNGTVDDDGACTTSAQCKSNTCAEGVCVSLCPRGVALGALCAAGKPCARIAVALNPRLTANEVFDDAYDYLSACVPGATGVTGPSGADPAGCAAPRQLVFRPTDAGTLVGACLTPIAGALAEAVACQENSECTSGLCIDHECAKPCATAPADTCGMTAASRCDLSARAQLADNNGTTALVAACRKSCTAAGDCPASQACEPDPGTGAPRFCRQTCAADKDCAPGQACTAGPPKICAP